ncbi:hypothetical protein QQF64_013449 [Cirrhinus molitorella]|uniref:Uncharacterized protein n=1 Tax=Cirrhinus molitorella TaxID=172907 RepID=A0ABR3LR99_9TELE
MAVSRKSCRAEEFEYETVYQASLEVKHFQPIKTRLAAGEEPGHVSVFTSQAPGRTLLRADVRLARHMRLLNDWTLLHSASLMDGKQGRPLFHPDSLTRLIY